MNAEAKRVITENCERHRGSKFILLNSYGLAWDTQSINAAFARIRKRASLGRHVTPYSIRHWWITSQLEKEVPAAVVAELAGTSLQMIQKHYSHLGERREYLRRWVD
jgi:integrase